MGSKVSIVIPCYNYELYICDAIESCLNQNYKGEIEIIVVDDASKDDSFKLITERYGNKIQAFRLKHNVGYSAAKNYGIEQSTGEYIAALDADDMLTHDSISVRAGILDKRPDILLVHAQAWVVKGFGDADYWSKRTYKLGVSHSKKIHAQSVMVRRLVYSLYGLYDEKLRSRSDNEMWFRLEHVAHIGNRFHFLEYPVSFYRKHELSMIEYRKKNKPYNAEVTRILEEQKLLRVTQGIKDCNTKLLRKNPCLRCNIG